MRMRKQYNWSVRVTRVRNDWLIVVVHTIVFADNRCRTVVVCRQPGHAAAAAYQPNALKRIDAMFVAQPQSTVHYLRRLI